MQILCLWAGIPFIAIGALLIVSEAKARRGALAVPGRVVGFSRPKSDSDESYHVVVEYEDVDGRRRLIESAVGSGVPVLYDPGIPAGPASTGAPGTG